MQEAFQLLGFDFGAQVDDGAAKKENKVEEKSYVVPEDRAIGRPHMMGWLDLLGEDEELTGGKDGNEEAFEADKWEEVKA